VYYCEGGSAQVATSAACVTAATATPTTAAP